MSMKIVGYKQDGQNFIPITEEIPDPEPKPILKEELLQKIKNETTLFFSSTNEYMGIGFDETSTKAYEKGAMMVYNILFPT